MLSCRLLVCQQVRRGSSLADKLQQAATISLDDANTEVVVQRRAEVEVDEKGEPFNEMFVMPKRKLRAQRQLEQQTGRAEKEQRSRFDLLDRISVRRPRSEDMDTSQDWTAVWPAARTFNASVVPLPIRMGTRPDPERRAPFKKQGNLELVKIPNFLHLTPAAIKKHCDAIKKFCTPFPEELKEDSELTHDVVPVSLIYNDYVHQGSSIRDNRARVITTQVKLADLHLDASAEEKIKRLLGSRYDEPTDTITILTDRCHTRKQNMDYAGYLLTVLYHESQKHEAWEQMKQREDNLKVEFEGSRCESELVSLLRNALSHDALKPAVADVGPDADAEALKEHEKVKEFGKMWFEYRNTEETPESTRRYAESVRSLLGLDSVNKQPRI